MSTLIAQMSRLIIFVLAIIGLSGAGNAQSCTIGGSTKYCGYADGKISGGFSAPCSCNRNFCCSQYGYCGPEPGIATDPQSVYCGTGCQPKYGTCSPGPSYFEYIGTGKTCGTATCPVSDTVNQQSTISAIPMPTSAPFYFIVFLLSDQYTTTSKGTSTGTFGPIGLFADGVSAAQAYWDPAKINLLASRAPNVKVMASIAGDTGVTRWQGVSDQSSYVATATASLRSFASKFKLAGFDINYEESINGAQAQQWVSAWCQIIANLKQDGNLITFAPYKATITAYKNLQDCLTQQKNTNIDFIIYQSYSEASFDTNTLTTALKSVQTTFAPTKIIAGVSNSQLARNPKLVPDVIRPLISQGVLSGASVFDADTSSAASPKFGLENQLWAS